MPWRSTAVLAQSRSWWSRERGSAGLAYGTLRHRAGRGNDGGVCTARPASGGHPEIGQHGISGFLCRDADTLIGHSVELANDDERRARMSSTAAERSWLSARRCSTAGSGGQQQYSVELIHCGTGYTLPQIEAAFGLDLSRTKDREVPANSRFTASWVERLLETPAGLVYPPVALAGRPYEKRDLIASIGRFDGRDRKNRASQLKTVLSFGFG
jgi:hypothetical protein